MNDQTILEEGNEVGADNDSSYRDSVVMSYNGSLYPFLNGKMLKPLGINYDDIAIETAKKICRTVDEARKKWERLVLHNHRI